MKKGDKEEEPSLTMRKSEQQIYRKLKHNPGHELPSVGQLCLVSISRNLILL